MLCPVCNVDLLMSQKNNIEIDYCPKCRGIWLDRGELDKIIEKNAMEINSASQNYGNKDRHYDDDYYKHHKGKPGYSHYKKKSLLGELFDF